jgi:hypothetical protein
VSVVCCQIEVSRPTRAVESLGGGGDSFNLFLLVFVFIDLLKHEAYCPRCSLHFVSSVTEQLFWL